MAPLGRLVSLWIRHGETAGNAAGTFRGPIDFPLTEKGHQDARDAANFLKNIKLSAIYTSPKQRTRDTAMAIAAGRGLEPNIVPSFVPIHVGYLAGELKSDHPHAMDYFDKFPDEKIPGGGESINGFRVRATPDIQKVLTEGVKSKDPNASIVHSSIIHEVNHIIHGDHNMNLVKPGGVLGVYHHPQQGFSTRALFKPEVEEETPYHA